MSHILRSLSALQMGGLWDDSSNSFGNPSPSRIPGEDGVFSVPCVFFQCPLGCSAIYPKAIIDEHMLGHLRRVMHEAMATLYVGNS